MAIDFTAQGATRRGRWFRYDSIGAFVMAVDVVAIVAVSVICGLAYNSFVGHSPDGFMDSLATGVLFAALFVPLVQLRGLYRPIELLRPLRQVSSVLALWAVVAGFLTIIGFALKMGHSISRITALAFVLWGVMLIAGLRFYWHGFMVRALASGAFATRRIAMIGDPAQLDENLLARQLAPFGLTVVARMKLSPASLTDEEAVRAVIADAVAAFRGSHVEEIVIALNGSQLDLAERVVAGLRILPLPIRLMLDSRLGDIVSRPIQRFGNLVSVELHRAPMTLSERGVKRALDIVFASVALFLISPLLAITALAIRLDSPGPVLFRQTRNGFNNRPFKIFKFRSMHVMEDGAAVRQASRHDSRVTAVGRLIRRLSIDELPQLWNVLRGEMSIVGPRPHALAHDEHFEKLIGDYPYRQHVKPGLTGWAQVNGSRGETPTTDSMVERVRLDIWYVENSSVWLDMRIIARTFTTLLNVKHTY